MTNLTMAFGAQITPLLLDRALSAGTDGFWFNDLLLGAEEENGITKVFFAGRRPHYEYVVKSRFNHGDYVGMYIIFYEFKPYDDVALDSANDHVWEHVAEKWGAKAELFCLDDGIPHTT